MVGHGGSSAGSYLTDPTSPIPSHCASIVATSTVRVNRNWTLSGLQVTCYKSFMSHGEIRVKPPAILRKASRKCHFVQEVGIQVPGVRLKMP